MDIKGKRIAVLGLADSGVSMLKGLAKAGAIAVGYGFLSDIQKDIVQKSLKSLPCKIHFGEISPNELTPYEIIIETPGGGHYSEALNAVAGTGVKRYSDLDFACEFMKAPIIAVTGTCGKSTTVQFAKAMLEKDGLKVKSLGGKNQDWGSVIHDSKSYKYYLLELSSFRLLSSSKIRPYIAVLLNIFPAHSDRHEGGLIEYVDAKAKIFANQETGDYLIYDAAATNLAELMKQKKPRATQVKFAWDSPISPPGIYHEKLRAIWSGPEGELETFSFEKAKSRMPGFLKNAMAAICIAKLCGVGSDSIQTAIDSFRPLPGRLKRFRSVGGVAYYDDSMSTNVGSAIWALESFSKPIIWIGGGKVQDGSRLNLLSRYVKSRVKACILIGKDAPILAKIFEGVAPVIEAVYLDKAIMQAKQIAEAGDVVLFSPACPADLATTDAGKDRGTLFKKIVKSLPKASKTARRSIQFTRI